MNWVFRNGICPGNRDASVHRHFIPMSEYKRQFILNKKENFTVNIHRVKGQTQQEARLVNEEVIPLVSGEKDKQIILMGISL